MAIVVALAACGGTGGKLAPSGSAALSSTASSLPVVTVPAGVGAIEVKDAKAKIDAGDVAVIDVRVYDQYATAHIPGSKDIDSAASDFADRVAPLDHGRAYVVYSNRASRSAKAVLALTKLGFTNVVEIVGGFDAWVAAGYPSATSPH